MRTTIDIPDETYRGIKILAAERGTTVRDLVLQGVELVRRQPPAAGKRFAVPVVRSKRPGTLHLTNEQIDELTAFSDVNVWLALHHQIHEHHEKALAWFEGLKIERRLVFCRQTQMGFFRLLTTGAVMGDEVLTKRQCWTLYGRWIAGGKATLENEPAKVSQAFEQRTLTDAASPKEWTDAYLAAFAETARIQLVTFDRALAGKAKGAVLLR